MVTFARVLKVEYCGVQELLPDYTAFHLRAGVGWKEDYVGHATLDVSCNSVAGFILLSRMPVLVEDLRTETRFTKSP